MSQATNKGEEILNQKDYEKLFDYYKNHLTNLKIANDFKVKRLFLIPILVILISCFVYFGVAVILSIFFPMNGKEPASDIAKFYPIIHAIVYLSYLFLITKIVPFLSSKKLNKLVSLVKDEINPSKEKKSIKWFSPEKDQIMYQYRKKKLDRIFFHSDSDSSKLINMIEISDHYVEESKPSKLKWPALLFPIILGILDPFTTKALSIYEFTSIMNLVRFIIPYSTAIVIVFFSTYAFIKLFINLYYDFQSTNHYIHKSIKNCLTEMYYYKNGNKKSKEYESLILAK